MSVREDRKNAVAMIAAAAQSYKNLLVGKRFLYVFDGRYIEVLFESNDAKKYTDILFMDAAATLDDFPNEVKQMLSNELLEPIKL